MIQNPFIVAGRIPAEFFCDRTEETEKIIKLITNGNNLVLISPRRMGKTELIKHCFESDEISRNFNTIFLDILQTSSFPEFIYLLGKTIYDSLLPGNKKIAINFIQALKSISGKLTFDPVSSTPSFSLQLGDISKPEYTLKEIFDFIDSLPKRVVIAIDEFQQITNYPEKNIEAILRTYIQDSRNCNFIFAGSQHHLLKEMFLYPTKPFYNSTSLLQLNVIPEDIYTSFVVKLFNKYNKNVEVEAVRQLYNVFNGYTYYMQRVLNRAFSETAVNTTCGENTVKDSLREVIEDDSPLFRELLSGIPLRQKELLLSIAREGSVGKITSSDFIRKYSLSSSSSVQAAAKKLRHQNLITRFEDQYSITDKFLAIWLNKTY